MYSGVIDPAPDHVVFAVFEDGRPLAVERRPMRGRDAATLVPFVEETLKKCGLALDDVKRWTAGSGPGSFTGLRLIAALVQGWCMGKSDTLCRNVPGALALAGMLKPAPGTEAGALYDGRNKELLFFGIKCDENGQLMPSGKTAVLNRETAEAFFAADPMPLALFSSEEENIRKILPAGIEVKSFASSDPALLDQADYREYDNDLTSPVYIRPAVYLEK